MAEYAVFFLDFISLNKVEIDNNETEEYFLKEAFALVRSFKDVCYKSQALTEGYRDIREFI